MATRSASPQPLVLTAAWDQPLSTRASLAWRAPSVRNAPRACKVRPFFAYDSALASSLSSVAVSGEAGSAEDGIWSGLGAADGVVSSASSLSDSADSPDAAGTAGIAAAGSTTGFGAS